MLTSIIKFSLRFRGIIIALACAWLGYGLYALWQAKTDVFPEFAPPQVIIQTEAPGLGPEQVEALVTQPIENALNGLEGIEALRSNSIQGLSVVTVIFSPGGDIYRNRQIVAERLATLGGKLPQWVKSPIMTPLTSSTSTVYVFGLTSNKLSPMELRTVADWTIKPRLLSIGGVAKIGIFGGEVRQLQIQLRPEQLIQYNLSIEDVIAIAKRLTGVRGAGFIDTKNQRVILSTQAQSLTASQLAEKTFINGVGSNLPVNMKLGDIANVVEGPEPPIGAALIMGEPAIQLVVSSQYGANTLEVTRQIEKVLDEISPTLKNQGVTLHLGIFRPANFIETATSNVNTSLLIGAILVTIVLFIFLANFKTAIISCTAIPLSLLTATTILKHFGISLNTITLGGLAIAIGEVVDDAVIDVENILRRLRGNSIMAEPKPIFRVVLDASLEVRSAVVYATFAVALVFIPILTMSGIAGRLFSPLAIAYIIAILASLCVALTVTPALCLAFFSDKGTLQEESSLVRWMKDEYRALLLKVEKHPKRIIFAVVALIFIGLGMLPFFGGGFLPEFKEGHFIVHMSTIPGTSIAESLRLGKRVSDELLKIPYVRLVAQRVGRAEAGDDTVGTYYSEFDVELKPLEGEETELAQAQIRKTLSKFLGATFSAYTFLTERIEETLSGYRAPVVINIVGNDPGTLDDKAREISALLNNIPGAANIQIQSPLGAPEVVIEPREKDLLYWGFDPLDVLDSISVAFRGDVVGQIYDGNRIFDVSVILDPQNRKSIDDIGKLPLRNPTGAYVRLKQIADIRQTSGHYVVLHQGARRIQTATCDVTGRDVDSFVREARNRIQSEISFPAGVYVEFGGVSAGEARSKNDLLVYSFLAGLGIILLLSVVMGNIRNLSLVMVNLPFAFVGGVFAVFFSGGWLSIGSLIGFVTLFGITLRNSIMMLSHYEYLVYCEGMTWGAETAIRGACERLTPILMTAIVTALGLLPLAIGSGEAGREIEGPMALVILGGLLTSTVLNLLVLPTLSIRYGRFEKKADSL